MIQNPMGGLVGDLHSFKIDEITGNLLLEASIPGKGDYSVEWSLKPDGVHNWVSELATQLPYPMLVIFVHPPESTDARVGRIIMMNTETVSFAERFEREVKAGIAKAKTGRGEA